MDDNYNLEKFVAKAFDLTGAQPHSDPADTASADFFEVADDINIIKSVIVYTFLVYKNNNIDVDIIDNYINRVLLCVYKRDIVLVINEFMRHINTGLSFK